MGSREAGKLKILNSGPGEASKLGIINSGFREDYGNRTVNSVIREAGSDIIVNSIRESNREINYNKIVNSVIKKDRAKRKFISRRPRGNNIRRRTEGIHLKTGSVYNREAGKIK